MAKRKRRKRKIKTSPGRPRRCYDFETAKELIKQENLGSSSQYAHWWKLHTPAKFPKRPDRNYEHYGWKGWNDFLGTDNPYPFNRKHYRKYEDAKAYIHQLNLKSMTEWKEYIKTNNLPQDIPRRPDVVYNKRGDWITWSDFLGNRIELKLGRVKNNQQKYFYVGKYDDSPTNVFVFGVTTSKNNLTTDNNFIVVRLFNYYEGFDWKDLINKYSKPYNIMGRNEYMVNNIYNLISELSLDLDEIKN